MFARPGDSRPNSHRPARRPAARLVVFLVTVLAALPLSLGGCGAGRAADTTTASTSLSEAAQQQTADQESAAVVRDFFATTAAGHFSGLTIDKLEVTTEAPGQVLFLTVTVTSDDSAEAMISLDWIYEGAMTSDGWPTQLANERGVRLVAIRFIVNYPTGEPDSIHIDVGSGASSEGGKPRFEPGGPNTTAAP